MTDEEYEQEIRKELSTADRAAHAGNEGMVRVCARRAAGTAIRRLLERRPQPGWEKDVMGQLRNMSSDKSFPQDVRESAARLCARISSDFAYDPASTPLNDARAIIDHISSILSHDAR